MLTVTDPLLIKTCAHSNECIDAQQASDSPEKGLCSWCQGLKIILWHVRHYDMIWFRHQNFKSISSPKYSLTVSVKEILIYRNASNLNVICKLFIPKNMIGSYGFVIFYAGVLNILRTVDFVYSYTFHQSYWMWSAVHQPFSFVLSSFVVLHNGDLTCL